MPLESVAKREFSIPSRSDDGRAGRVAGFRIECAARSLARRRPADRRGKSHRRGAVAGRAKKLADQRACFHIPSADALGVGIVFHDPQLAARVECHTIDKPHAVAGPGSYQWPAAGSANGFDKLTGGRKTLI